MAAYERNDLFKGDMTSGVRHWYTTAIGCCVSLVNIVLAFGRCMLNGNFRFNLA